MYAINEFQADRISVFGIHLKNEDISTVNSCKSYQYLESGEVLSSILEFSYHDALSRYFGNQETKQSQYPRVGDTLKYKGMLRISWSYDMKYNKNIDLFFFLKKIHI